MVPVGPALLPVPRARRRKAEDERLKVEKFGERLRSEGLASKNGRLESGN